MTISKKFAAVAAALLLSACNESYKGALNVSEDLQLNVGRKTKTLGVGQYDLTADVKETNKIAIKVAVPGRDVRLTLQLPNGRAVHPNMGEFRFAAAEIGQNYDVLGNLTSVESQSDEMVRRETCVYDTYYYRDCDHYGRYPYPYPNYPGYYPGYPNYPDYHYGYCRDQMGYIYGTRYVRFYEVATDHLLEFAFSKPDSGAVVAAGEGSHRQVETHYTHVGRCERY